LAGPLVTDSKALVTQEDIAITHIQCQLERADGEPALVAVQRGVEAWADLDVIRGRRKTWALRRRLYWLVV